MEALTIKVGKRYTIVIPKVFREKLGLKEGHILEMVLERDKLILIPKVSNPFKRLSELMGDIVYNEEVERKAELWLLGEASQL